MAGPSGYKVDRFRLLERLRALREEEQDKANLSARARLEQAKRELNRLLGEMYGVSDALQDMTEPTHEQITELFTRMSRITPQSEFRYSPRDEVVKYDILIATLELSVDNVVTISKEQADTYLRPLATKESAQ